MPVIKINSKEQAVKSIQHSHHQDALKKYDDVALVFQGGGALGSYQAGAYEELSKSGIEPTWIAGISIGALNSAIIAGNPPELRVEKLKGFWEAICSSPRHSNPFMDLWTDSLSDASRKWLNNFESKKTMMNGQNNFFSPKFFAMMPFQKGNPDEISYYDTRKLKDTLLKFADFDLINKGDIRVSLGVVNVASGEFSYFDNTKQVLTPEHFMASGALPPSFPAVKIDGEFYWDGGLVTNTPILEVINENKSSNKLVFQIDLWNAQGKLPENFNDITERTQDIKFSSRHKEITQNLSDDRKQADMIAQLLALIPENVKRNNPVCKEAQKFSKMGDFDLIHLTYDDKGYEGHTKSYEFSSQTMKDHWGSGQEDMLNKLKELSLVVKKHNRMKP